jgi:hypothetical protein
METVKKEIERIKVLLSNALQDCEYFELLEEEIRDGKLTFLQARKMAVDILEDSFQLKMQRSISLMKQVLFQGELIYKDKFSKKSRKRARFEIS